MRQKKKSYFNSKAHIVYIYDYRPALFNSAIEQFENSPNIYAPRFPSIIKSDGTVWHLASIYLNYLLIEENKSCSLIESTSSYLVDLLRFFESTMIDILHLPAKKSDRVTYKYHATLIDRIKKRILSPSTARQRMNRSLRFYDKLLAERVFSKAELKNRLPKGSKICNDTVALEAGLKRGAVKRSRPELAELLDDIKSAEASRLGKEYSKKDSKIVMQTDLQIAKNKFIDLQTKYETQLQQLNSLIFENHTLKKELKHYLDAEESGNIIKFKPKASE